MGLDTTRPFAGSDAVRAGDLTWGLLAGPGYRRLDSDTYVAAGVADSPLRSIRAALMRAGPGALATGWSACVVLGLDVAPRLMPVEIAADRRLYPAPGVRARRQRFAADEVTVHDGLRVTTPLRTTFDLGTRSGPVQSAVDRVIEPLTDAVVAADALARLGEFSGPDLLAFAARHRGARGVRRVSTIAALLDPGADSPPETRTRVKLVLAGLPRPVTQYEVRDERGLRFWLDLAWPEYRVAVEYDGRDHAVSDRRGRDVDRIDDLRRRAGWIVIVVTAPQLARPHWVPDRVREDLESRGWTPGPGNEWAHVLRENELRSR